MLALLLWGLAKGTATPARPEEDWRERSGAVLRLADGELARERGGVRVALGCTDPAGTGRVLDVALDPAGLVFVAAERGLFVLGPFVDVLDPVERAEGAPAGRATSLYVDAERRVWLATEDAIGVLEPSFFWGRTLAREDLPGRGPYRVEAAPDGVLLSGAMEQRVHRPNAGARPRVTAVRLDGVALASGARLARTPGGTLRLDVAGEADGGATFRYRLDGHHVWRALGPGAAVRMPPPGARILEVIALDQSLTRSEPWVVRLQVAYPKAYEPGFVLGAAAGGVLLVLSAFLLGQRARARVRPWRALVSTGLALALALQVVAGLVPHGKGWPFIGFDMYTRSFARGEVVYDEQIVVLHADGGEFAVRPQSAGFVVDEPWEVLRPLIDGGEPALRAYLAAWRARFPHAAASAVGLQVQARRARLTPEGPVRIAPLVLAHHAEERHGDGR